MAAITVGVPVYNEARRLPRCIEILRGQTFADFEVLIFDNASQDETGEIAREACARDPRFRYFRQPVNKGVMQNFRDVMNAAQSPYFLWRAADDSTDPNYLEELNGLLHADPSKHLAVARSVGAYRDEVLYSVDFPKLKGDGGLQDTLRMMFGCTPGWFYGLYRREALLPTADPIFAAYDAGGWGADFLHILPFFMDGAVAGSNATSFTAALRPRRGEPGQPPPPRTEPDLDHILAIRRQFLDLGAAIVDRRVPPGPRRALWSVLLRLYADRRVYKTKHILRRSARRLVGLKP